MRTSSRACKPAATCHVQNPLVTRSSTLTCPHQHPAYHPPVKEGFSSSVQVLQHSTPYSVLSASQFPENRYSLKSRRPYLPVDSILVLTSSSLTGVTRRGPCLANVPILVAPLIFMRKKTSLNVPATKVSSPVKER